MSKTLINLTTPLVISEIEQVLITYPHHPYQQAFANPDLRQELIAYVLTRVQNIYTVCEDSNNPAYDGWNCTTLRQEAIRDVIRHGILDLFNQHSNALHLPEQEFAGLAASHWFG
jgi:hypothetical protein